MPTHERGAKSRETQRNETAKQCQNLTSFFATVNRQLRKCIRKSSKG